MPLVDHKDKPFAWLQQSVNATHVLVLFEFCFSVARELQRESVGVNRSLIQQVLAAHRGHERLDRSGLDAHRAGDCRNRQGLGLAEQRDVAPAIAAYPSGAVH